MFIRNCDRNHANDLASRYLSAITALPDLHDRTHRQAYVLNQLALLPLRFKPHSVLCWHRHRAEHTRALWFAINSYPRPRQVYKALRATLRDWAITKPSERKLT